MDKNGKPETYERFQLWGKFIPQWKKRTAEPFWYLLKSSRHLETIEDLISAPNNSDIDCKIVRLVVVENVITEKPKNG
jgi:hypothetical protein